MDFSSPGKKKTEEELTMKRERKMARVTILIPFVFLLMPSFSFGISCF